MGYPTKVQRIKRKASEQWYINFPAALAQALEFERGEVVEWVIEDRAQLLLRRRRQVAVPEAKKKRSEGSPTPSMSSSSPAPAEPAASDAAPSAPRRSR